jgi:hypothetical protein
MRQLFRRAGELERRTEGAARECDASLFECAGKDILDLQDLPRRMVALIAAAWTRKGWAQARKG